MTDLIQKTLTVTGLTGISYTFRIPGLFDEYKIAARVKDIRKKIDPNWDGFEQGLDAQTQWSMRGSATFEIGLVSASDQWVFSKTKDGLPVIDSAQWPEDKMFEMHHVYEEYLEKVSRFRATGSPDAAPDGAEAVAGEPDTGAKPV